MVNRYFACTDCKVYVDAGYRWAAWRLEEPGLVTRGKKVSIEAVLSARDYWTPCQTESAGWLYTEVLPSVFRFLGEHRHHRVVYGDTSDFFASGSDELFDWMQVGFLPLLLPRYFVERLGLSTWDEVTSFIATLTSPPWWWMLDWDDLHAKARKKFQQLVQPKSQCQSTRCPHTTNQIV